MVRNQGHGDAFDNGAGTQISRTFLPILCIACVSLVLWSSGERRPVPTEKLGGAPSGENPDDHTASDRIERAEDGLSDARDGPLLDEKSSEKAQKKERLFHVDFARICAVMCVIFEHSGGLMQGGKGAPEFSPQNGLLHVYGCRITIGLAMLIPPNHPKCSFIFGGEVAY